MKTNDIIKISFMTALIAIGAYIKIPAPIIGVFTLQLSFVLLAGIVLGSKKGAIAIALYAVGGLLGIPWFAYGGGLAYVLQPTFGFILAFIIGGYIVGVFRERSNSLTSISIGAVVGTLVVWILGMMYLWMIMNFYQLKEVALIPLLFSIFSVSLVCDLILAFVVAVAGKRIITLLH